MKQFKNYNLSRITSFGTGGPAENFIIIEQTDELHTVLQNYQRPLWFFGSGANSLVSDQGLPGTTIQLCNTAIEFKDEGEQRTVIVDSGVNWDLLVQQTIDKGLWGMELMSGIPGTVGAAIVGNIAAYGQQVADSLQWVEVIDTSGNPSITDCLLSDTLGLRYRYSDFQNEKLGKYVIVRAAFALKKQPTHELAYESAVAVANELSLSTDTLTNRRAIIIEARRRAGSLLDKDHSSKTAGSFFRNPTVTKEQAEKIISYEEHGISSDKILKQNLLHGGDSFRVSAAHVLLAAGFKRGQSWGAVRLHPEHILKIENTGGASSQNIYDVAQEIIATVQQKLGITIEAEVRFLGKFD